MVTRKTGMRGTEAPGKGGWALLSGLTSLLCGAEGPEPFRFDCGKNVLQRKGKKLSTPETS